MGTDVVADIVASVGTVAAGASSDADVGTGINCAAAHNGIAMGQVKEAWDALPQNWQDQDAQASRPSAARDTDGNACKTQTEARILSCSSCTGYKQRRFWRASDAQPSAALARDVVKDVSTC
jgi:hypothetical protein